MNDRDTALILATNMMKETAEKSATKSCATLHARLRNWRAKAMIHTRPKESDDFASAEIAVWQATGCPLPREVFEEFRDVADPEARIHHMCAAAIATADCELETLIENKIDAYLEDCAAAHARGDHLDKLANLAANAEDKPVFRGRRKRVQVSGVPV